MGVGKRPRQTRQFRGRGEAPALKHLPTRSSNPSTAPVSSLPSPKAEVRPEPAGAITCHRVPGSSHRLLEMPLGSLRMSPEAGCSLLYYDCLGEHQCNPTNSYWHPGALGTCEGPWEKPIVSPGLKASCADSVGKAGVWETTRSQGALGFPGS